MTRPGDEDLPGAVVETSPVRDLDPDLGDLAAALAERRIALRQLTESIETIESEIRARLEPGEYRVPGLGFFLNVGPPIVGRRFVDKAQIDYFAAILPPRLRPVEKEKVVVEKIYPKVPDVERYADELEAAGVPMAEIIGRNPDKPGPIEIA